MNPPSAQDLEAWSKELARWRMEARTSKHLAGEYTQADRQLWTSVEMGFPYLVDLALKCGGNPARVYHLYNYQNNQKEPYELNLLWWALSNSKGSFSPRGGLLMEMGLAEHTRGLPAESKLMRGEVVVDRVDAKAVAVLLVQAGADAFRPFHDWVATQAMPELAAVARGRDLNKVLPTMDEAPTKTRL